MDENTVFPSLFIVAAYPGKRRRYKELNRRALEDAALYARTGRVRTPSPAPSSEYEEKVQQVFTGTIEHSIDHTKRKGRGVANSSFTSEVPLSQELLLLSSDSEEDFCQCEQVRQELDDPKELDADDCRMTSGDSTCDDSDTDFHASDCKGDSASESDRSSSKYARSEKLVSLPTRTVAAVDIDSHFLRSTTKNPNKDFSNQYHQANSKKSVQERMVTSVRNEDRPKAWFKNDKPVAMTSRKTRSKKTVGASTETNLLNIDPEIKSGTSTGQKVSVKGKKKGKTISPAVVDVVFNGLKSSVADVDELRRKREEDARKCGRVVRSVGNVESQNGGPEKTDTSSKNKESDKDSPANMAVDSVQPSENETAREISEECINRAEQENNGLQAQLNDEDNNLNGARKQYTSFNEDLQFANPKGSRSTISRIIEDRAMHDNSEAFEGQVQYPRIVQPIQQYRDNRHTNLRGRSHDYRQRSPWNHSPRNNGRVRSPSPQWRQSESRRFEKEGHELRKAREFGEESDRGLLPHRYAKDVRQYEKLHIEDGQRRWSRDLSTPDDRYRHRRSISPDRSRRHSRRSPTYERSRSPSLALLTPSEDAVFKTERELGKSTDLVISSSSAGRRMRRYKRGVREDRRSQREKQGHKPFYLTLNGEGIPYGPGRPAWISEVNKVAAGLDPSITHIRKQTHEDMCILNDRLDDNFEYSGELNQDHLRGLLGKAVTRKRTELISYINMKGEQPLHFDREIWKRLEKLASSKQREKLTEHGRYANACRRTMGRTGSLGMEGVRRRLRQFYGRSPDPDEVAQEMERHKGYGTKKGDSRGMPGTSSQDNTNSVIKDQFLRIPSSENVVQEYSSEEGRTKKTARVRSLAFQETVDERAKRGSHTDRRQSALVESTTTSKDEYIAQLEAQIRGLTGDKGKGSAYRELLVYDSGNRARDHSDKGAVGYSEGTSRADRSARTGVHKKHAKDHIVAEYDEV